MSYIRYNWEKECPPGQGNGIGPVCRHCNVLIDWHPYDHAKGCPEYVSERPKENRVFSFGPTEYPPLSVVWDHNVDPPIPLVSTIEEAGDGFPSICVHDRDDSLRMMWAEIERLRSK